MEKEFTKQKISGTIKESTYPVLPVEIQNTNTKSKAEEDEYSNFFSEDFKKGDFHEKNFSYTVNIN